MWRVTAGTTDTSACPLFLLTGQALPAQVRGETREIRWGGWFRPDTLMSEADGLVNWTSTGGYSWRGVVMNERVSNDSATTGASVVWQLTLVSPTEITGSSVFEYDICSAGADAAALSVLQNMQCRSVTPFTAQNRVTHPSGLGKAYGR